jgi:FSR family fosmidomycin resistance protein-like MFS transporter
MTRAVPLFRQLANRRVRPTAMRFGLVAGAHPIVDVYAGFVTPLIGVLQVRCDLTAWQAAFLLSVGPVTSGLAQPLFAWLSDRIDSRIFGSAGLAVAAAALSSIGLARTFPILLLIYGIGMLGVGAFHPVAAASAGQLAGRRRSLGVTVFFVAGMIGATIGPLVSTRVTALPGGFDLLRWAMIPGLLVAMVLHVAIRRVPHRHHEHHAIRFEPADSRRRWATTILLSLGNALRYSVSIGLFYVYVRWAEANVAATLLEPDPGRVATLGSLYSGELNAMTMLGMGVGGLIGGILVRQGRERLPLILVPLVFAPAIALFPASTRLTSYGLALAAGMGYATVIPLTISLAQRLLPHRTSLASSLTMGGAWALAMFSPPTAEWAIKTIGLDGAFLLLAGVLATSGLLGVLLPRGLLRDVADTHAPVSD